MVEQWLRDLKANCSQLLLLLTLQRFVVRGCFCIRGCYVFAFACVFVFVCMLRREVRVCVCAHTLIYTHINTHKLPHGSTLPRICAIRFDNLSPKSAVVCV